MTIIYASTEDQHLIATVIPKLAQNNVNTVRLHVAFDSSWDAYPAKSAVFTTSKSARPYPVTISSQGDCLFPQEVLVEEGKVYIVVRGENSSNGTFKSSTRLTVKVLEGHPAVIISDPSPSVYQQLLNVNAVLEARMRQLEVAGTVEGSEVIGIRTGADGKVYATAGDAVREQLTQKADKNAVNWFYGLDIFTNGVTNLYTGGDVAMNYTSGIWQNVTGSSFSLEPGTYTLLVPNIKLGVKAYLEYVGGRDDGTLRILELDRTGFYTFEVTRNDLELEIRMLVSNDTEVAPGTYGVYGAVITKGITNTVGILPTYLTGVDKKLDRKVGKNLFDKNSKDIIYYKYLAPNGDIEKSTNYYVTGFIPIKPSTEYVLHDISFGGAHIVFYNNTVLPISAIQGSSINADGTFTTPANAAFVRLTGHIDNIDMNQLEEGSVKTAYEPYTDFVDLQNLANRVTAVEAKTDTSVSEVKKASAEALTDGTSLSLGENLDVKKNKTLMFYANIDSFNGLRIGHGETAYSSSYIDIDSSKVTVYEYTNAASVVTTMAHGLNLTNFVSVVLDVGVKASVTICTSSGSFTLSDIRWSGCNGPIFAKSIGSKLRNCDLKWTCSDLKADVWVIGDSYLGLTTPERYPYHLLSAGFDNWLACGYPGAGAYSQKMSVTNLLSMGTPKYLVWTIGMNNMDNGAINSSWLNETELIIEMCQERGITPILATIPSTWDSNGELTRDNSYKNAWIKSSGYRYVDFEKAVGADKVTGWYDGMMSSDGVHPAELGAKALAARFIVDVPEIASARVRRS